MQRGGLGAGIYRDKIEVKGTIFVLAWADSSHKRVAMLPQCQLAGVLGRWATLPGSDGKPTSVTKHLTPITEIYMPGGGRGQIEVKTQGVGVTEKNDIEVLVANPIITIMPGQTVKVDVEIKRRPDYSKPVTLDLRINHLGGVFTNPLPAGITVDDGATIAENQTKGTITLHAAADAKPISNLPLAIMANVSINFVMKVWFAAPITLTVKK